ncbi:glycosyltransferase [Roseomonas marmotae]|uniref:Glycosyltransferase n=2 Tax=Roseomonas marmotae TaxID=2768161 RepID=A0ABS3KEA4_9PROT|nr:glycosyltransferase [Roseomonas marmotae]MBO1075808.1 glycosyltransferase [Roseomonas marmotae]QTI80530.1 glycosyltransferase [Roseomonas marmotae]
MRVAIFVTNASGTYGGGRLAAFLLAQCLARAGAEVAFVTNAKPVFYEDLKHFGHPGRVAFHQTKDFHAGLPAGGFDIVIIIPGQSQDRQFYIGARGFARRRGARLVLFNFETPNWFNSQAPTTRSEDMWLEWRRCIEDGCLVLSNSEQSMRFAQDYYCSHPETTFFDYWHQPINLQALARVAPQYRENRAVCFVRARDPHKGGQDLIDALSEDLRGWTLSLIVGSAKLDEEYHEAIAAAARRHQIAIEVKPLLSDTDKFVELKRARMLIYPSRFEGYGIPPIEALSAGTPCVCYDLPVFREVCGDALIAVPSGDIEGLRAGIRQVIASSPADWNHLPQQVASVSSILQCGQAALAALQTYLRQEIRETGHALPAPRPQRPTPHLVYISGARLDPAGFIELRGWSPLRQRSRLMASVNGVVLGEVTRGLARQDVLEKHPWLGTADCGFVLCHPLRAETEEISVTVTALGRDGTQFDSIRRDFAVADIRKPAGKPDPALYQRGGVKFVREGETGYITGWVATTKPLMKLEAFAGNRTLWLQYGRTRPDVMAKLEGFPPQAPGFAIHLSSEDMAALDEAKEVALVTTAPTGVFIERLKVKWEEMAPGVAELPPELPSEAQPHALPLTANIRKVTYDEYGVAEFEGYVLSVPRVDVIKFWLGDVFLGEGMPDRLYMNIFEKNRVYGDAFCGFQFTGRAIGLPPAEARYRVEFCYGEDTAHVVEGIATPSRRAAAALQTDAALWPQDFLTSPTRPAVAALVVEDARLLDNAMGAAHRALLTHLRHTGQEILIILHGNPHRFSDELPRWRALADAVLLVNPVTPVPGAAPLPFADWNRSSAALQAVLASLAGQMPRLAAVLVQRPALAPALAALPEHGPLALVLEEAAEAHLPWREAAPLARQLGPTPGEGMLHLGLDPAGIAAQVMPMDGGPAPDGRPWLVLNGTSIGEDAYATLLSTAADAGLRLGAVIDAPPLETAGAIQARLGLPPQVEPLWLPWLAAMPRDSVRAVLDLGGGHPGALEAVALQRGFPLGLWKEVAPEAPRRPWPALHLTEILAGHGAAHGPSGSSPYAALDEVLAGHARRVLLMAAE